MKFPPLSVQKEDELSIWRWFREVIRVRNAFPAIARGVTEGADALGSESVAAFFRRSETDDDLLIVMNLRAQTSEIDLSAAGGGFALAAVLNTNEERIVLEGEILTLPAYSIAVLTE